MAYTIETYLSEFDFLDGKESFSITFKSRSDYERISDICRFIADLYVVYEEEDDSDIVLH